MGRDGTGWQREPRRIRWFGKPKVQHPRFHCHCRYHSDRRSEQVESFFHLDLAWTALGLAATLLLPHVRVW